MAPRLAGLTAFSPVPPKKHRDDVRQGRFAPSGSRPERGAGKHFSLDSLPGQAGSEFFLLSSRVRPAISSL